MNVLLIIAFLFYVGSTFGWVLELLFRKFFSANNPEHKWVNPGFCVGPYVPLYGFGLAILYILAAIGSRYHFTDTRLGMFIMFLIMAVMMTVIEYIAGIMLLKIFHMRLWDYSMIKGNIQGLICPLFSLAWAAMGALYYFLIHPNVLDALDWLSHNLQFSFFIGMFFGFFIIDVIYSGNLVVKVQAFAKENEMIVHLEDVKLHLQKLRKERGLRAMFFLTLRTEMRTLREYLDESHEEYRDKWMQRIENRKKEEKH